ncbi:MAG: SMI1/KNR4 family protein [Isosphaeraceae bacterium]
MSGRLGECVARWVTAMGIDPSRVPSPVALSQAFEGVDPCRPPLDSSEIDAWERRHGYRLPRGLRMWLQLSNGFYLDGPLIHPLSAIGPMVPFARVPELVVQPESWFELGNPNVETVCIDLGYRWPKGGHPIFTSGDDHSKSSPRVIAAGFDEWFVELLRHGGKEYWFEPGFRDLGHPWPAHRAHAPAPPLPERLRPLASRVRRLMQPGVDDRVIASELGISLGDVETLFRHLQHRRGRAGGR